MLADTELRRMFLEEGRVAGLLQHTNVVSVLDVGEDAHGPYLLMPFVDGVPMSRVIAQVAREGDLLPVSVVVQVVQQAANGLVAAHELRDHDGSPVPLVHRDISPQNILVDFDGNARVLDFGIAKVVNGGGATTANLLKGKFAYMAPEQLRFEGVTPQSDLYSLGVVLFEALSACRLHTSRDMMEVAQAVLTKPPPDISEIRSDTPVELERLLFEMLAKDPANRPASARDVSERLKRIGHELYGDGDWIELADYMRDEFGQVRQSREEERGRLLTTLRSRRRTRRWLLPAAAATLVAVGVLAFAFWGESANTESTLVSTPLADEPPAGPESASSRESENTPGQEESTSEEPVAQAAEDEADQAVEVEEPAMRPARMRPRMRAQMRAQMRTEPGSNSQRGNAEGDSTSGSGGVVMDWW